MAKIGTITIYPINEKHGAEFVVEQDVTPFLTKRRMTRWGAIHPSSKSLLTDLLAASVKQNESWVNIETQTGTVGIFTTPIIFKRIFSAIVTPETKKNEMQDSHTYIPGVFLHFYKKSSIGRYNNKS